jgi:hypothetical protein
MISEIEVRKTADVLIERFGTAAEQIAAQRADGARKNGDRENAELWTRISEAIRTPQKRNSIGTKRSS